MNQLLRAEIAKGFAPKLAVYNNAGERVLLGERIPFANKIPWQKTPTHAPHSVTESLSTSAASRTATHGELAAVLSHELAHLVARHSSENLTSILCHPNR